MRKKHTCSQSNIDFVGVGGITYGWQATCKRELGAKAVQGYTGFVYRGPTLLHEMHEDMAKNKIVNWRQ